MVIGHSHTIGKISNKTKSILRLNILYMTCIGYQNISNVYWIFQLFANVDFSCCFRIYISQNGYEFISAIISWTKFMLFFFLVIISSHWRLWKKFSKLAFMQTKTKHKSFCLKFNWKKKHFFSSFVGAAAAVIIKSKFKLTQLWSAWIRFTLSEIHHTHNWRQNI